jgi:hypothetical protein
MTPTICRNCHQPHEPRDPAVQERWNRTRPETEGLCMECKQKDKEEI